MREDHALYASAFKAIETEMTGPASELNPIDIADVIAGWLAPLWKQNPNWDQLLTDNRAVLELTATLPEEGHDREDYKRDDFGRTERE